jgi:hypothetical protein
MSCHHKIWIVILNCPPHLYFLSLTKVVLLKVIHPLTTCQNTKCNGAMLTGATFAPTSEV